MARNIQFDIEVQPNGDIEIKLPEGPGKSRDAGVLASFTDKLSKLLGRVKERHVGTYDKQGVHVHQDGSTHQHHGG